MGANIKGLGKLKRNFAKLKRDANKRYRTDVGFFAKDKYPDGTSVSEVAERNEFDVPKNNQPARPFMRTTVACKQQQWVKELATVLKSGASIENAIGFIGGNMTTDIQDTISKVTSPPLARKTVEEKRKKGSQYPDKPLEDTRFMFDHVKHIERND